MRCSPAAPWPSWTPRRGSSPRDLWPFYTSGESPIYLFRTSCLNMSPRPRWSRRVDLPALTNVYQAGEALTITPTVRNFFECHPQCRLHNHYGPAETHVVTAETLSSQPETWSYRPLIGRPVRNTRIYVLDGSLEPVRRV